MRQITAEPFRFGDWIAPTGQMTLAVAHPRRELGFKLEQAGWADLTLQGKCTGMVDRMNGRLTGRRLAKAC